MRDQVNKEMPPTHWGVVDQRRPLDERDTADRTFGCRHSNPNICKNNSTAKKCAFVRDDGMCLTPPRTWTKLYRELLGS